MSRTENELTDLEGVMERITFQNPDNGFTIARFNPSERAGQMTVMRARIIVRLRSL